MAKGPRYNVPFRRRREGKTDYRQRKRLLLSRLPRLVVRGSLKHFTAQLIEAKVIGDKVIVSAHSRELVRDYGWRAGCGNLPAAFLTGLLCGLRAAEKGIKEAVPDIGLHSPSKGARVFAAIKGFIEAGVMVPHDEDILPDDERVEGRHIANYASNLASTDKELYERRFSNYLSNNLPPEDLPKHFHETKERILSAFNKSSGSLRNSG